MRHSKPIHLALIALSAAFGIASASAGDMAARVLIPNLFTKAEYRVANYGQVTLSDANIAGAATSSITFKPWVQTVATALVYRFNSVAAQY